MDLEDVIEFGSVTVRSHSPSSHSPERCSIDDCIATSVLVLMVSPALTLRRLVQCLNEATGKTILNCLKAGAK